MGLETEEVMNARLERIHLAEVTGDREAMNGLRVEQARLVLYGSLAIAGGALTAVWAADRAPCMPFLRAGLFLLGAAAIIAWQALLWESTLRARKIVAAYAALSRSKEAVFGLERVAGLKAGEVEDAQLHVLRTTSLCIWLNAGGFIACVLGGSLLLTGFLDSLSGESCKVFFVWPLTSLN